MSPGRESEFHDDEVARMVSLRRGRASWHDEVCDVEHGGPVGRTAAVTSASTTVDCEIPENTTKVGIHFPEHAFADFIGSRESGDAAR